jgi:hypothetical protein
LSISLDTPEVLSEEDRNILTRLMERSVHVCLTRRIRPDYTNIALYNAVHLILLGQVLDRHEVSREGKLRLQNIVYNVWNHGIFEYNSPPYYFVDVDALQLGLRHGKDAETRQTIQTLLEFFWTDISLHWYAPGERLAGAMSRTDNFLTGTSVQLTRILSFAGLAPYDDRARYHGVLNSFRAVYQPSPEIVQLNSHYPRLLTRNWGPDKRQWATVSLFEDIALGTAGTQYEGMQNILQVVDLAGTPAQSRSYFIADGREDPYGVERSPSGRGGQQKALHLDVQWFGAQHTVDSLGIVLYPPKAIAGEEVVNVQSHFVVRKPATAKNASPHPQKSFLPLPKGEGTRINEPIIFRYDTCAIGIRVVWARDQHGQPAKVVLVDDGNEHDVLRLTVEHGKPIHPPPSEDAAGAAFWIRIGSGLKTHEQFLTWQEEFRSAKVHRLEVNQNDIDIAVEGQEGVVAVNLKQNCGSPHPQKSFPALPVGEGTFAAPLGILTLNGKDLGRPLLEKIPAVAAFVNKRNEATPIVVNPSGTYWKANTGYSFFEGVTKKPGTERSTVPGHALINHDLSWQLQVEQPGEYFLWGRVQTRDAEHDSFFVETAKRLPDGSFMHRSMNADWHLGTRANWTWVRLPVPIRLEKGVWQLTLKPREYEGRIEQLFLTSEPAKEP